MKRYRFLLLAFILFVYAFSFIATKRVELCTGDCEKVAIFRNGFYPTRESYILGIGRCSDNRISDTLCITVRDTSGIDWNVVADSACIYATRAGLPAQKIFIFRTGTNPPDTLAKKQCP
ncbi:MAG: hypothetical protein NTW29_02635 [Bacteroidetes bacterium]|nr:hypothetical protein [Bacteroidota bacterium]